MLSLHSYSLGLVKSWLAAKPCLLNCPRLYLNRMSFSRLIADGDIQVEKLQRRRRRIIAVL
jgi:hypothetical protein